MHKQHFHNLKTAHDFIISVIGTCSENCLVQKCQLWVDSGWLPDCAIICCLQMSDAEKAYVLLKRQTISAHCYEWDFQSMMLKRLILFYLQGILSWCIEQKTLKVN